MPKRAVDQDIVDAILERVELPLGEAESPGRFVVRGAIGDPVGMVREGMQMRTEFISES